jgi:hypothetical protein
MTTADKERSPCLGCPNHLNKIDKRLCLTGCKRLAAYRTGKDWTKEEIYIVPEGKNLIEDINSNAMNETGIKNEDIDTPENENLLDDDIEAPGPVRHIVPEPGWKKTVVPKPKKEVPVNAKICPICGKAEGPRNRFLRGVCNKPCYRQWYAGKIEHPVLGKFKPVPKDWSPQTVAVLPESQDNDVDDVDDDICVSTINVSLELYPLIREAIYREVLRLSLPVSHVAVTLLAEALENRRVAENLCRKVKH